jgi:serine/threonine protein kinase/tetratricopeptide (TPR) repeat protein
MAIDTNRAKELFFAAADINDAKTRAAYLNEECAGDSALRGRVEALLRAHAEPDEILDAPPARPATIDYAPITERVGSMIGPYKLMEQIGEGGFGLVFVAEQQEPVKRKVALKVIKPGMDTREVISRFEAERQALALMDHPNIARVFDAGATDSGRPYFVMELVRGIPITDYCDKYRLPPRERLELFVTVCQAIQHAHQKGIIHRDVKPTNILVTSHDGKPVVKVIDFGVAKAIHQQLTARTVYTNFAQMVGTPLYMSPEQAEMSGLDIDTRSDIYSLGVLLYELLTGTTPLEKKRFAKAAYDEIRRLIREEEPQKPSTRVSTSDSIASIAAQRHTEPAKLSKLMRGDLDWITMKALEKDRTRRYETANGLARDIQRYLSDEPVEACPPSTTYRLRKFAKKNRAALTMAATFALLLITGAGVSIWQAVRATRAEGLARNAAEAERLAKLDALENEKYAVEQRSRAEKAHDRTRDALDAMTSGLTGDSLMTQTEISADQKKFLSEVLTYYQEFAGKKADDEQSRVRIAHAAVRVGQIEQQLGRTEQAIVAVRMAEDGYRSLVVDYPTVAVYQKALAQSHLNVGFLLKEMGKPDEAEERYRLAIALMAKLAAEYSTVPVYRQVLAVGQIRLGNLHLDGGKQAEAEEQYRMALSIVAKLAAEFPTESRYRQMLGVNHFDLGRVLIQIGKRSEAEQQIHMALAIQKKLAADYPTVPAYQVDLAGSHNSWGNALKSQGKIQQAEEQYRLGLALADRLAANFPGMSSYKESVAGYRSNLGLMLDRQGKREEAEQQYRMAMAICEKLAADCPANPKNQIHLGMIYGNFANLVRNSGRANESFAWLDKAIVVLTPVHRAEPRNVYAKLALHNCYVGRARANDSMTKHADAVKDWDRAVELTTPTESEHFADRANRATSRVKAGLLAGAIAEVVELTKSSNLTGDQWCELARIYTLAGGKSAEKNRDYTDRAMELLQKAVLAGYQDAAKMRNDSAFDILRVRDDFKPLLTELDTNAIRSANAALKAREAELGQDHADTITSRSTLASTYRAAGHPDKTLPLYETNFALHKAKHGLDHPETRRSGSALTDAYLATATVYAWQGRQRDFAEVCRKAAAFAADATVPEYLERAVKAACMRTIEPDQQLAYLELARRAVKFGEKSSILPYFTTALGMAEYRAGRLAEADQTLAEAIKAGARFKYVTGIASFYRAMALHQLGRTDEARKLSTTGTAAMKPMRVDESNPLSGGTIHDDLILLMAYKEAKGLIGFAAAPGDSAPTPPESK